MKKILYILILLLFFYKVYSQNYDLIVTTKGDSIACRIDSITNTEIYFEMKVKNNWFHTYTNKNDITEYKLNEIDKKAVIFKSGTSYIESSIDKKSAVFKPGISTIESSPELNKNAIYATVSSILVWVVVNVNYERMIRESNDRFIQSLWIRVGAGTCVVYGDPAANYVATLTALTGKRDSHLEFGLGATYISEGRFEYVPAFSLGYRYQKPIDPFVFRTGIGYPELIYLSFGYSF